MKNRHLMLAALLAAVSMTALAEEGADEPRAPRPALIHPGDFHVGILNGMVATQIGVAPLRNAPYSGQTVTERRQSLADGNQIATRRTFMAYRDSAGRTRLDATNDKGETETITIHDPVAGVNVLLKPQERIAIKTPMHRGAAERLTREDVVKRIERLDPEIRQRVQEQMRAHAQTADRVLRTERVEIASSLSAAFGDARWAAQATTKELGTREFNGVKANGRLRSYEIPAGAIGNRNAIQVSTETWTAPDLQVTVYTKHVDPRNGEVEFRLENLKREEPAASLFAMPSDYTVKEPLAGLAAKAGKAQQ